MSQNDDMKKNWKEALGFTMKKATIFELPILKTLISSLMRIPVKSLILFSTYLPKYSNNTFRY